LIFEASVNERLDYVIGVSAPQELRIQRAMERDNVSREEILKRMGHQIDEKTKIEKCDFVLINDEDQFLIPQVLELHQKLLNLAKQKING
jgi:dephospho-CoA kinase